MEESRKLYLEINKYDIFVREVFNTLKGVINPKCGDLLSINTEFNTSTCIGLIASKIYNIITFRINGLLNFESDENKRKEVSIFVIVHELYHTIQYIDHHLYQSNQKYRTGIEREVEYKSALFMLNNKDILFDLFNVEINDFDKYKYLIKKNSGYTLETIDNNLKAFYSSALETIIPGSDYVGLIEVIEKTSNVNISYNGETFYMKFQGVLNSDYKFIYALNDNNMYLYKKLKCDIKYNESNDLLSIILVQDNTIDKPVMFICKEDYNCF